MSKRQEQPEPSADANQRSLSTTYKTSWTDTELDQLTLRAQKGDTAAMRELRQAIGVYPALERQFSDMATIARQRIAEATFGKSNLLLKETLDRKVAAMRRDLEGPAPTPLERLLIERIITCWTAVYLAEISASASGQPIARAEYLDKRVDRAHHRYLTSLIALAKVRRLLAPTIAQINIAQSGAQQLNVALPSDDTPHPDAPVQLP